MREHGLRAKWRHGQRNLFHFIEGGRDNSRHGKTRTCDRLVPNQWIKSHKSLSWRHLLVFGPLADGQVLTSALGRPDGDHHLLLARPTLRLTAGECKTLNALFGVAYDREHLKSRPSVGQLLGNLVKRRKAVESNPIPYF